MMSAVECLRVNEKLLSHFVIVIERLNWIFFLFCFFQTDTDSYVAQADVPQIEQHAVSLLKPQQYIYSSNSSWYPTPLLTDDQRVHP